MTERQVFSVSAEIAGRTLTLEAGRFAEQADGAVTVRYGDTLLLATVVGAKEAREGVDFFPLTVDYEERMYSAGKIPGNFFKREGRPTTTAILTSRLTDRPLRPLFPKGYQNEVQVIITTFAMDMVNDPGPMAIIGASAALAISDLPFQGPVGAVQMGFVDGQLVANPPMSAMEQSRLDLVVAGTRDAVLMVEAGAYELTEAQMLQAVTEGHQVCQQLCDLQEELVRLCGKPKREFVPPVTDTSLEESISIWMGPRLREAVRSTDKTEREERTSALKAEVVAHFTVDEPEEELAARSKEVSKAFEKLLKAEVRDAILDEGLRVDGRALHEIRPIAIDVGVLPRVHGTGLFSRGQTQVLTITTLGSPGDEQRLDDLGIETTKRYIHHYNFPPFSTGEAKRMGSPRRRDIGHGALAERSLHAVLPTQAEFPYTMRLVSEVLSSNGSSSMASVCGSSLSMMDAGVPLKSHVAGVAMGLITDPDGRWKVLTDIQGLEDALGDMDFKVAGTAEGITGLQMDIKTTGITYEIMAEAFEQARQGRLFILDKMNAVLPSHRTEMSPHAPRIISLQIPVEKIGALIGPGGKTIRGIVESTGAQIDVEDDGRVFVTSSDGEGAKVAVAFIEGLTREAKVGDIFLGKVVSIKPFGAFVNILPGKDGMVHVSELAETRVENVEDVIQIGDEINVMVIAVDGGTGKISLSRRAVLTGETADDRRAAGAAPRSDRGDRGGDRGDRRGPPRSGSGDRPRPRRREQD
ncbi:polyribonucleotide nucleotidyltransferase [Candidatus Chloroploca asiatica]|uniref:Polyribonucleotide nucleotidyltransferase n=1 Tax=Candidatus Chloroploca asiatica TaxID=1506545 RepID=A0A2H3KN51_9CHLR|nr:polyribonucleotide nucleotidyltransferase [Candidatus Chloroploca asiatica]PDV99562.1 polyribonucleotide nucleotidyltransferase [Candidatus Chloroploca asiatica]